MERRARWYQRYTDTSWRVDETYVKVAGQWAYLYRAIDKNGDIDFMLSPRRTAKSARRFLGKALRLRQDCPPEDDQHRPERRLRQSDSSAQAVWRVGQERSTPAGQISQQPARGGSRRAEAADKPTRGFKTLPTASATIKGFEVMRMIRKRQCLMLEPGTTGEVRFVNRLFRLAA